MTPQERLRIFQQRQGQQQGRTAEERRRLFFEEQARRQQPQLPPQRGILDALGGGLAQAGGDLASSVTSIAGALGSAAGGDFRPLGELAESAGRGALKFAAAFDPAGNAYAPVAAEQDPRLAELAARQQQRQAQTPAGRYIQQRNAQLAAEAEQDTSRAAKIARGAGRLIGSAAPAVVTGVLSGGSIPAMAATTAAQSAGQPEAIIPSTVLGAAPVPVGEAFRAGISAVRRAFGKGAAQIIEAEALPAATAQVRQAIGEAPPVAGEAVPPIGAADDVTQQAIRRFEEAVQRINAMNVSPNIKAAEMRAAIAEIGREARGIPPSPPGESMVQSQYPRRANFGESLPMVMPDVPNPIQRAGALPGGVEPPAPTVAPRIQAETGPPALEADFGVSAAGPAATRGPSATVSGPALGADMLNAPPSGPPVPRPTMASMDADWDVAWANQPLQGALFEGARALPMPLKEQIKNEILGALGATKSIKSMGDISAPFRQGWLLMAPPTKWRQAGKAWGQMFRAFRAKDFEAIKRGIDYHPNAKAMEDAGLYLANRTNAAANQGEEAFLRRSGSKISEFVSKAPGVKQSDQAYTAFLDTQRVERFAQYKNIVDKAGLSTADTQKAYKAAAEWINIATGRGSLGQRLDKALDALSFFFFSPRYIASRLNVFNPAMYIRNASSPGGRVILKEQMKEVAQLAGVAASTIYLAKAAGADVDFDLNSRDFLRIRFGNYRYDFGAGLTQVMRMFYRVGADIARAGRGEKPKIGETATDIAETFLSYKLSPPAAVFRNFINQRTPDKKPFTYGGAAADLVAPIQWADFVEAYQKEGWAGVGMATPGAVGIGVQNYEPKPVDAAIERAQPLFTELQRLNRRVSDLRRKDGEKDDAFNARVQQFGQNYTLYGLKLLENPRFQAAPDAVKALALDRLNERAKAITSREVAFPEIELDANSLLDAAESSKKNPAKR